MAVRSARILLTVRVATSFTTYYTVPSGRTLVLRQWLIANSTGAAATLLQSDDGQGTDNHRMNQWSVPANTTIDHQTWEVYGPGEVLNLRASAANTLCVSVSGALLEGVVT